jgi:poly-gamma-glutamate synthesis protein (capsule biosynthesis protein)
LKIFSPTTLNNDFNKEDGIKILLSGDFCPHKRIEELCLNENYEKIYNDFLPVLRDKDISITNLECPLSEKENPIRKSGPNLMASPKCIEGLKYGGFDVVLMLLLWQTIIF